MYVHTSFCPLSSARNLAPWILHSALEFSQRDQPQATFVKEHESRQSRQPRFYQQRYLGR